MTERTIGDPVLDLVAAVFRLAVKDARQGDQKARQWLWIVAPDWAERYNIPVGPDPNPTQTQTKQREKVSFSP